MIPTAATLSTDPTFVKLVAAWMADPRNEHLPAAILDWLARQELHREAAALRRMLAERSAAEFAGIMRQFGEAVTELMRQTGVR